MDLPDTPACAAAQRVALRFCTPALFNHSMRSYVWAAFLGRARRMEYDAELLFVSAMLHDLGLTESFDNDTVAFEVAGGYVAEVFAAGAGWSPQRGSRAAEVIERHMWPSVDPALDPEGHLLEVGTGVDISGSSAGAIPADLRDDALREWPRLALASEFAECFRQQGTRKPHTRAAAIAEAVGQRLADHPFERD